MQLWPFKKRQPEKLSPTVLRDRLIEAAGNQTKLQTLCGQHKDQVATSLDVLGKVPDEIRNNETAVEKHVQALIEVAQCLINEFDAPELWEHLLGSDETNPFRKLNRWYAELPERKERLEYPTLIAEAGELLEKTRTLQGIAARQNEAILYGQQGDLLFHSGRVQESVNAFQNALQLCINCRDVEGQKTYLANLFEVFRYLGNIPEAVRVGHELTHVVGAQSDVAKAFHRRIHLVRKGEPLCRINCVHNEQELELDEIQAIGEGRYEFQFRRNRISLQMAQSLVKQGNELGTAGKLKEAMEKYAQATRIDPYDPDPVYQTAVALLESGEYAKARIAFNEVEQLAPGWFRCRSDQWLSNGLVEGTISDKEFRILRVMEDGQLSNAEIVAAVHQVLNTYPNFAPLYLILGDGYSGQNDLTSASLCYRKGLELAPEPDLESRLLCALATILPKESPERSVFFNRILSLNGSLVAKATAQLMLLPSA